MADILILSVAKRKDKAVKVQEILTGAGCMIKTSDRDRKSVV